MYVCGGGFALLLVVERLSEISQRWKPGDPNPELLTEDEAIRYLRLDTIGIKNPDETLQRYRTALSVTLCIPPPALSVTSYIRIGMSTLHIGPGL